MAGKESARREICSCKPEEVLIDPNLKINFRIDLSLIDQEEQSRIAIMDTKYKIGRPKAEDIEQAVFSPTRF